MSSSREIRKWVADALRAAWRLLSPHAVWSYVLVGGSCALFIISDTPLVGFSGFWATHVIVSGLIVSLLSLAIAVVIIGHYLQILQEKQWHHVARIAFQDLAREVMLVVRMMAELSGEADYRLRAARPMSRDEEQGLHDLLGERLGALDVRKAMSRDERLRKLFEIPEWGLLAYTVMQQRCQDGRLTIARWAPIMVSNDALVALLTKVAEVMRDVEIVQAPLVKLYVDKLEVPADAVLEWCSDWSEYEATCESVHSMLVPDAYMYNVARELAG
jgi:hypothetical protein